jgi:hypothetical protein
MKWQEVEKCRMRCLINLNDQVKEDKVGREFSTNAEKMNACRILLGKPEGKRPLGRPRRRIILKWILRDRMR